MGRSSARRGLLLFPLWGYRPEFFLGGSIGSSFYPDQRSATANWLNNTYTATTPLSPGDFITTFARQDWADFAAKLYGGTWITPNVGIEAGFASLGRIGWSTFSTNTTGSFAVTNSGRVAPHAWYESLLVGLDSFGIRYFLKGGAYEASTDLESSGFNLNTGAVNGASETVHNSGGLVGLGIYTAYYHTALRIEVEDFINVGQSSVPLTSQIPPWRGSILVISAGAAYRF